jgi:Carbohydrate family 9 binding domain-like/Concanavalin A-like lectin/glucanases superfamily
MYSFRGLFAFIVTVALLAGSAIAQEELGIKKVAFWPLDEGAGKVVHDKVGKNNGLLRTNDPAKKLTWAKDGDKSELVFPGSAAKKELGGYVEVAGGGRILEGPLFAIGLDVFLSEKNVMSTFMVTKHGSTKTGGFLLSYWDSNRKITFSFSDGREKYTYVCKMKKRLPLNKWVSVSAIYDNDSMILKVDGKEVGRKKLPGKRLAQSHYKMVIGSYYSNIGSSKSMAGKVRNVWLGVLSKIENKAMLYNATPAAAVPVIDGKLDDATWKKAAFVSDFVRLGKAERVEPQTEFAVVYGKKSLYVAARCFQPDMNKLKVKKQERDGWETESFELFIDPDASGDHYFQVALSVHNTQFDAVMTQFGSDTRSDFDMEWTSAVARANDHWTAELEIPYSELLVKPENSGNWHFNVCRNNSTVHKKDRYSTWGQAPKGVTVKGFHDFNLFGMLVGLPKPQYTTRELKKVKRGRRKWALDVPPVREKIGLNAIHNPLFVANNMVVPNWLNQKAPGTYLLKKKARYILDLPKGLTLLHVGRAKYKAGGGDPGAYSTAAQKKPVMHKGKPYTRHVVTLTDIHRKRSLLGPIWISSGLPGETKTDIYFAAEWVDGKQKPQKVDVLVKKFPTPGKPRGITSSLAWMNSYHYLKWPNFLDTYGKLGFNTVPSHYQYDKNVPQEMRAEILNKARKQGFKILAVGSPFSGIRGKKEGNSTGPDGEPLDLKANDACPAYRGEFYQSNFLNIKEALAWMRPDILHLDIECYATGSFRGKAGGCQRCKDAIKASGKPAAEAIAALGTEHMKDVKHVMKLVSEEKGFPMPELGIYHNQPGGFVYQDTYSFDHAYAAGALDTCHPVFYRSAKARDTGKEVRHYRSLLKRSDIIPWMTAGYSTSGGGPEYPSEWVYDYVLEVYGSGARGTFWFAFAKFEGADFYYHAKAFEVLTPISHLIPNAIPIPGVKSSNPSIGATAMGIGEHILLLMSDYKKKSTATVTVTLPIAAQGKVWNIATRKAIGTVDGKTLTVNFTPGVKGAHTALYYVGTKLPEGK